ncbi:MAG: ATP-binding protein [Elusimicrobiales bacterium]
MRTLLVKAVLILAGTELLVMFLLPHGPHVGRATLAFADTLLMLLIAMGPLYLLLRGERRRLEKRQRLDTQLHAIVSGLWKASLHTISTEDLLDGILREVLENSPISIQKRGAIFLTEGGNLRLKASIGFDEEHRKACGSVAPGRCLCGTVLQTGETLYSPDVGENHHIRLAESSPHGHYCAPIKSAGKVIGALNLYLEPGHRRDAAEEEFLGSVCAIIARIIEGKRMERSLFQMQKMEALNRFAAGIAHDFNNILGAIAAYASTAEAGLARGKACADDLREIDAAVKKGVQLTRQLKLFSRQQQDARDSIDVNALVEASTEMLRRIMGSGIAFETRLCTAGLPVRASRSQLDQVILNLATNARDAMPGGGAFTVETAKEDICFVNSKQCLKAARISVSDTGGGMEEGVLERIFEPFFTTKCEGQGSGLGLAIVHGIVHQHGGELLVRSSPGAGTRFDIYLPLEPGSENDKPQVA